MALLEIRFDARGVNAPGHLTYVVRHSRRIAEIDSNCKLYASEWDSRRGCVSHEVEKRRQEDVQAIARRLKEGMESLREVVDEFEAEGIPYAASDIKEEYIRRTRRKTLSGYVRTLAGQMRLNGQTRTSETYVSALHSFLKYRGGRDIALQSLTAADIEGYQSFLRRNGVKLNSISFYMRVLRAAYNKAVENGDVPDRNPFAKAYTGICRTRKRALPLDMLKRVKKMQLGRMPNLDYARDMFLLSFYMRGMSFVDMAFLRKGDLREGAIEYTRRKTGRQMHVKWTKEMQAIIEKYPCPAGDYLLPIILRANMDPVSAYRNAYAKVNRNLRSVGRMLGLEERLTLYVARHSWATAAQSQGIPLSVISAGMGHESELTTRIYLSQIENKAVDDANARILRLI